MEITGTAIQSAQSGNIQDSGLVLKEGEQVTVSFVKNLEAGMFIISVNGKNIAAQLSFDPNSLPLSTGSQSQQTPQQPTQTELPQNTFPAFVMKTPQEVQLKIFPPLIDFSTNTQTPPQNSGQIQSNPQQATGQSAVQTSGQTAAGTAAQPPVAEQTPLQNQPITQQSQTAMPNGEPIGTATLRSTDLRMSAPQTTQTTAQSSANSSQTNQTQTAQQTATTIQQAANLSNANQIKLAEAIASDGKTLSIKLPPGSIPVQDGELVQIDVVKTLDNGKTLIAIKNKLFEVDIEPQVFRSLAAEAQTTAKSVDLTLMRLPVESLDQTYVKQQVTGLNMDTLLKAFGKFTKTDMSELKGQDIKNAIKDSGLLFESKLAKGDDVSSDEKMRAYVSSDNPAKEGITRMQVANLMMAGGVFAFMKTQDENVGDTFIRYKKGRKGSDTIYVSTEFSELGETLIIVKPINGSYNITIKTEKDISSDMGNLNLENGSVRWYKFNKQDLDVMNPKNEISNDLGSFEVII